MCNTHCKLHRKHDEIIREFDALIKTIKSLITQCENFENTANELPDDDPAKKELLKRIAVFGDLISTLIQGKARTYKLYNDFIETLN
jgi:hypothetical protein